MFPTFSDTLDVRTGPQRNILTTKPGEFWQAQAGLHGEQQQAIWRIQIAKFRRDPDSFDIVQLARVSEGLTGAEVEQLFIDSLHEAFSRRTEPSDLSIATLLNDLVPLSKLMSEQMDGLRRWAKGRARLATQPASQAPSRKLAV